MISIILSSVTIYSIAAPFCASTNEITDYDLYKQYTNMSNSELEELGMTADEVEYIRSFSYEEAVKKRADLSDEVLESCGYTEDDIEQLRNIASQESISEENMRSISSTLKTYIRVVK